jgi:stress response protein SCP2
MERISTLGNDHLSSLYVSNGLDLDLSRFNVNSREKKKDLIMLIFLNIQQSICKKTILTI